MSKLGIVIALVAVVVVGGGAFYGGIKYASLESNRNANRGNFARGMNGAPGSFGGRLGAVGQVGGGFTTGEILSKDATSVTLKLRDGGSKIIFYSTSTQMRKTADASITDFVIGQEVIVTGDANSDGSITAQMLQTRPVMPQMASGTKMVP